MYQTDQAVAEPEVLPFFVYGTLRPGQGNYRVAEPYVQHAAVDAELVPENSEIVGDLLYVGKDDYQDARWGMDRLEGISPLNNDLGHYRRIEVLATNKDGNTVRAWMYVGGKRVRDSLRNGYAGQPIITGDWLNR